jgi:hypothetical protein
MGSASELGFGEHTFTSATRTNGLSALESRSSEAHSGFCSLTRAAGPARSCGTAATLCNRGAIVTWFAAMPDGQFFDVVLDGSRLATAPASFKH